jgi:hypothetical protein
MAGINPVHRGRSNGLGVTLRFVLVSFSLELPEKVPQQAPLQSEATTEQAIDTGYLVDRIRREPMSKFPKRLGLAPPYPATNRSFGNAERGQVG